MKTSLLSLLLPGLAAAGFGLETGVGPPRHFRAASAPSARPAPASDWECGMCRIIDLTRPVPWSKYPAHRLKVGKKMVCDACSRVLIMQRGVVKGGIAHTCSIFFGNPPECCLAFLGAPAPAKNAGDESGAAGQRQPPP